MPERDIDGYPTTCYICKQPIVKARADSGHNYDDTTGETWSWHISCTKGAFVYCHTNYVPVIEEGPGHFTCTGCGTQLKNWVT